MHMALDSTSDFILMVVIVLAVVGLIIIVFSPAIMNTILKMLGIIGG